ncbi:NAD(P)H-dependent glycerol-3-phosphate dehydrogenase [Methylomonas montana]|uniref:NAD(P)H-dependent glycerol-3-phosphate dehydrogenase n=1 Tax=Methylomonas montana TaxID=3058963 RepID=UPI002659EC65|nr:NAD(P)H-dependent glycerol-3-phosphate dehydrogenase [Methylomonas montana]WKJ90841.1 NAD(P)H-dependent glycerol-3-phosphate dehydrogenase [Methylomonas montana]
MPLSISILGAGSWGTALAIQAARNGCDTLLWSYNPKHLSILKQTGENSRYLPGIRFPSNLQLTDNLQEAVAFSSVLLISVPSHAFRDTLSQIKPLLNGKPKIAWATKGFDCQDGALLSDVATQILGADIECAVLSGPTFAQEVAADLPTALTIASASDSFAAQLSERLHNQRFRIYTSSDMIGVQIGGASKNVLAIAAGIADGLGFGANTRAALITRGLTEVMRLGIKLGGQPDTFMGLAGLGDLILTCTDNQSRNRRFGLALGQGKNQQQALREIDQEVEGISAARETYRLSQKHGVEMPITEQVYNVLFNNLPPKQAVQNLLARDQKSEHN